jgi:methionyl-tRNA formyltransferase
LTPLRVAFAGTPAFALPALHALLNSHHTVVGVLTQPDRPKGRGRHVSASPVKLAALSHGVPVSQPRALKTEADQAELRAWQPDLLVVVAYGLILSRTTLDLPPLGCVNIHASLLPRWRGAAPIQHAILAGDAMTGVTIMRMEAGLDTGPILLQQAIPIEPGQTGGALHDRLALLGGSALLDALSILGSAKSVSTPQPEDGITYAPKISKIDAHIDWKSDAGTIERMIRAYNPWPIAETRLGGEILRIHAARIQAPVIDPLDQAAAIAPGTVVGVHDDAVVVACDRGQLALTVVQRPGRRAVGARDFANTVVLSGRRFE